MNPLKVNRIIKTNGLPMCIDSLSERCGCEISHRDVVMSESFFYCSHCGVKRHYVKRLSFRGRFALLFRKKHKQEFF